MVLPDPSVTRRGAVEGRSERRCGGRLSRGPEAVSRERVVAVRSRRCVEGTRKIRRRSSGAAAVLEGLVGGRRQTYGVTFLKSSSGARFAKPSPKRKRPA